MIRMIITLLFLMIVLMALLIRYWIWKHVLKCSWFNNCDNATTLYLCAIYYDNYCIVIADGDVDGNDVTESDDSYDYYINTHDDDDNADYDEILTVECDNSVKINSSDKCLNNSVLILYLLSINWCFLIILQLIKDVSTF